MAIDENLGTSSLGADAKRKASKVSNSSRRTTGLMAGGIVLGAEGRCWTKQP